MIKACTYWKRTIKCIAWYRKPHRGIRVVTNNDQKLLRTTFWEAVDGKPYTNPPSAHMNHCFDTLRQVSEHAPYVLFPFFSD